MPKLVIFVLITVTIMFNLINKVVLILLFANSSHDNRLLCEVQNEKRNSGCNCCNSQKWQACNKGYLSRVQHKDVPN